MRHIISGNKDFHVFSESWNTHQNLTTPNIHKRIITFLQNAWIQGNSKALLMAFRGCGKSTMVGLFCAWILYRNPNVRILVLSAESELAKRMVRTVKRIIERHPLTEDLKPKKAEQWAGDCFTVNRPMELRDASMTADGILGNITGMRADIVICDDVEVPNTANTASKRENLRLRLAEVDYILVPNGMQLYVGTPHTEHSIYASKKMGDIPPFLYGFERLEIPILQQDGTSAWAERFSEHDIHILKTRHGEQKFNAQMQLQCVNMHKGRLDTGRIKSYTCALDVRYANDCQDVYIAGRKMVSACCVWDPSYGAVGGDDSIVAVVFVSENGAYFVHGLQALCAEKDGLDPAHAQCYGVVDFMREYMVSRIYIEANGVGKFLPELLKTVFDKSNIRCAVQAFHSKSNKNIRIMESLQAVLDAGYLWVHQDVITSGFLEQMSDFNPLEKGNKDDMLDAVARCIEFEPTRLGGYVKTATKLQNRWQGSTPTNAMESDFTL